MARSIKNLHYLRSSNRISILKRLATIGPTSRVEFSQELGLSKMTITNLVSELILENLIEETSINVTSSNANGRKRTALKIPNYRINAIGLLIERYMIHCIAMDINGTEFYYDSTKIPQDADSALFISLVLKLLHRLLDELTGYSFAGIGISSIGPLDLATATILHPTNFSSIENVPLGKIITHEFQLPVFMVNCMSAGALAEYLYGQARNIDTVIYLGIGTGVGTGIILNQHIFTGKAGFAGELGHMSIDLNGPRCSCGQNGCLETYISMFSILKKTGYSSIIALVTDLKNGVASKETYAEIAIYIRAVNTALITIANLFDPDMIILGDRCLPLMELYLDECSESLNNAMIQRGTRKIPIKLSSFNIRAPLIGASALVFDKIFERSLPVR